MTGWSNCFSPQYWMYGIFGLVADRRRSQISSNNGGLAERTRLYLMTPTMSTWSLNVVPWSRSVDSKSVDSATYEKPMVTSTRTTSRLGWKIYCIKSLVRNENRSCVGTWKNAQCIKLLRPLLPARVQLRRVDRLRPRLPI